MKILAIESSCDETAVAIVENGRKILSNVVATSAEMHQKYGGIVPEIAARKQLESIIPVLEEALNNYSSSLVLPNEKSTMFSSHPAWPDSNNKTILNSIDAIAITIGPGLIGSLLIGIETAKTIAFTLKKPVIPVNHVLAHQYSNFLEISDKREVISNKNLTHPLPAQAGNPLFGKREGISPLLRKARDQEGLNNVTIQQFNNKNIEFPAISLVVSGGHTELYLMENESKLKWLGGTIDDAAGECFDKGARILGFGSGGGLAIQKSAEQYFKHLEKTHLNPLFVKERNPPAGGSPLYQRGDQEGFNNQQIKLPRPMLYDKTLNFSFSGLKTALMREVNKNLTCHSRDPSTDGGNLKDSRVTCQPSAVASGNCRLEPEDDKLIGVLSHELQEAITDVLVYKTLAAVKQYHAKSILISGGVASNIRLREKFSSKGRSAFGRNNSTIDFFAPPPSLCTDNAAFVASYAYFYQKPVDWRKITAVPDLSVEV